MAAGAIGPPTMIPVWGPVVTKISWCDSDGEIKGIHTNKTQIQVSWVSVAPPIQNKVK